MDFLFQPDGPPAHSLRPVMKNNASPPRITAAAGTRLAGTSSSSTFMIFLDERILWSFEPKFHKLNIIHAILLDQAFAHCPRFLTAASFWRMDRVSVPLWLIILSDQLRIFGLVSHYPTNYLILPGPILQRINLFYIGYFHNSRRSFLLSHQDKM